MADTDAPGTDHADLRTADLSFGDVPAAGRDAEVDPNWLRLRGESTLPSLYMPPSMPGEHSGGLRVVALILVAVFIAATAAGVCLTYGAPHNPF